MGYLSKEAYERKTEWAHRHQAEQKAITTLTEDQHELLSELCSYRHFMHCNQDSLCNEESADYDNLWKPIDVERSNSLITLINSSGLLKLNIVGVDDVIGYLCNVEANLGLTDDECLESAYEFGNSLNNQIEDYLRKIDKEHGTEYCPRGESRLY